MTSKKVNLLIRFARDNPTWEASRAEDMFRTFMFERFSYDELSRRPDYPAYASADVLAAILPLIINEMLARADTENYLVYPLITAVDPLGDGKAHLVERFEELVGLVDHDGSSHILRFLGALRADPPVLAERLDRIIAFWSSKAGRLVQQ